MRIPRISFKNLTKNKVVIFDKEGSDIIAMAILNDTKYTIIHCRKEKIHITFALLFLILRNMAYFLLRPESYNLRGVKKSSLLRCIYRIYLFSCIDYISPKIVITFIDNSWTFHWISRRYGSCEFYAIQNGMRFDAKRLYYEEQNDFVERSVHFSTELLIRQAH